MDFFLDQMKKMKKVACDSPLLNRQAPWIRRSLISPVREIIEEGNSPGLSRVIIRLLKMKKPVNTQFEVKKLCPK